MNSRGPNITCTLGLAIIFLSACAPAVKPGDAYFDQEIDYASEDVRKIRKVAVARLVLPRGLPDSESVYQKLERMIEEGTRASGFEVTVSAAEFRATLLKHTRAAGGVFDTRTGKLIDDKWERVLAETLDELRTANEFDAVLYSTVHLDDAYYTEAAMVATWCNTGQELKPGGTGLSDMLTAQIGTRTVKATCLEISLEVPGVEGSILYYARGGIEVLAVMRPGGLQAVPLDELFKNDERNRGAIDLAFRSLTYPLAPPEKETSGSMQGRKGSPKRPRR